METESNEDNKVLRENRKSLTDFFKGNFNLLRSQTSAKRESTNIKLLKYKEFRQLSNKTGLSPIMLLTILFIFLALIMFGFYEDHLTLIIGTVYPLYFSIKTLKTGTISEVKRWLTYWIFLTVFIWFESCFSWLLNYIPFYFVWRTLILVFSYIPQFEYSTVIYDFIIKKFYSKYQNNIKSIAHDLKTKLYGNENVKHFQNAISVGIAQSITNQNFFGFKNNSNTNENNNNDYNNNDHNYKDTNWTIQTGDPIEEEFVNEDEIFGDLIENSLVENQSNDNFSKDNLDSKKKNNKNSGPFKRAPTTASANVTANTSKSPYFKKSEKDDKDKVLNRNLTTTNNSRNAGTKKSTLGSTMNKSTLQTGNNKK